MTTTTIHPTALTTFEKELAFIKDDSLRAFFYNAIAVAPQSYHDDVDIQAFSRKAFHILRGLLEQRDVQGAARDALLGTILICDIMCNEFEEGMAILHTVAVRGYLKSRDVHKDINTALWENIMRAVESHHGADCISPLLEARPGTAEYEVATAFSLARLNFVELDWEAIYNEKVDKEEN